MLSEPHDQDRQDWFLNQIVEWANRFGVEVGVTLNAGGMLISGQMISGRNYFLELASEFRGERSEDDLVFTLGNLIERNKDVYESYDLTVAKSGKDDSEGKLKGDGDEVVEGESDEGDDPSPPPPTYIHLRNARIFSPGQPAIPGNRGVLWRSRISEISGFSLGSLSAD